MNKRTSQKEHTRERILRTSHELFSRHGFLKVNTEAVAKSAGISHGLIFSHFPSRDDLVVSVIERFGASMGWRMHDLAEARVGLRAMLDAHLQCIRENELFYSNLIRDLPGLPSRSRLCVISIQSCVSHHISKVAETQTDRGEIKPIAPDLLFNTWVGLIHHYLTNWELFSPHGSIIELHGQRLIEHFLNLIANH